MASLYIKGRKIAGGVTQLYNSIGQNVDGAITQKAFTEYITNSHTQYLHTLPVSNWTLQSGGDWDGYYANVLTLTSIYNPAGDVDARGATLASKPSDEVKSAVAGMYFLVDDEAMTLTAYTQTAPTVDCYVSVEGMV